MRMRLISLAFLLVLTLSACVADRNPLQARIEYAAGARNDEGSAPYAGQNEVVTEADPDPGDDLARAVTKEQTRAARMAEAVCLLPEVVRAAAVITGNTAIIGVETEAEIEAGRLIALKNSVEKAALAVDDAITHTAVTTSADLFGRIAAMTDSATFPAAAE